MSGRRDGQRGLTLIEVIVAVVLLGLISVVLSGGLRFGARVWETGARIGRDIERIQLVQEFLRRQVRQADGRPRAGFRGRRTDAAIFQGEKDRLRFKTLLPAHLGTAGFYTFELFLADGALQLTWTLISGLDDDQEIDDPDRHRTTLLLDRVLGLELAYAARPAKGEEALEWLETWPGEQAAALPVLLRLRLSFARADRRYWPELVIAPRLSGALVRGRNLGRDEEEG